MLYADFDLIIPVTVFFTEESFISVENYFTKLKISNSAQLEGSVLLDDNNSPLLGYYELNQKFRRKVGLHSNEWYSYTLDKENISFMIGKIRLWIFKNGMGYITIRIKCENLPGEAVLDLVSVLCNIRLKAKFSFIQTLGKDLSEKKTSTIKSVVEQIFTLSDTVVFADFSKMTFSKAKCIFYGAGGSTNGAVDYFLEMIRLLNRSNRRADSSVENDFLFKPYNYIYWAVSENGIFCYGDTINCGENNLQFLTENGGLRQSIFSNYELIYLNCLSVILKFNSICKQMNINNPVAVRSAPKDTVDELDNLLNTPIHDLSQEVHINKLMREYVCKNVFNWQDVAQGFETIEIRRFMEDIHRELSDIKEETIAVRKNTEESLEHLKKIEQQIDNVTKFICTDLSEWLRAKRKSITQINETDEIAVSAFVEESTGYIRSKLRKEHDLLSDKETNLRLTFGNVWDELLPTSQTSLISASVLWEGCSKISGKGFDYSGICICATAALEAELKKIFLRLLA